MSPICKSTNGTRSSWPCLTFTHPCQPGSAGFLSASRHRELPSSLQVDRESFTPCGSAPLRAGWHPAPGELRNFNTLASFKGCGKAALLAAAAARVWDDICSGEAERRPNNLARFLVVSYADLKTFHFHYWCAGYGSVRCLFINVVRHSAVASRRHAKPAHSVVNALPFLTGCPLPTLVSTPIFRCEASRQLSLMTLMPFNLQVCIPGAQAARALQRPAGPPASGSAAAGAGGRDSGSL